MQKTIYHNPNSELGDIKIVCQQGTQSVIYEDCLIVRKKAYSTIKAYEHHLDALSIPSDEYSRIYMMYLNGEPIATVSVTFSREGQLDCQQYYPLNIINAFHNYIGSSNKLAVCEHINYNKIPISFFFIHNCWEDVISEKGYIDIINVASPMVKFYEKLGYSVIPNHQFIHPIFQNESQVMFNCTDPNQNSILSDLFRSAPFQVSKEEILGLVHEKTHV